MDIEDAIRLRLLEDAPLASRLPVYLDSQTIFWGVRPQNSDLPALVLNTISRPVAEHLKGPQSLQFMRTQLDCYASDVATAQQLADLAVAALMPRAVAHGFYFRPTSILNRRDIQESTSADPIFRTWLDLMVRHSPA